MNCLLGHLRSKCCNAKMADDSDPFFGLGYEAGLFVWRMAGVRPRPLDQEQLGTFKSCACYIVAEATRPLSTRR